MLRSSAAVTPVDFGDGDSSGPPGLLRALPMVLRWRRSEAALFGRLNARHAAVVRLRIRSVCGGGSGPSAKLAAMPPKMRHRVELAPEVFRLVFHETGRSPREVREALERFCAVENHMAGRSTIDPRPSACWSALGDVRVSGAADGNGYGVASSGRPFGVLTSAPLLRKTVVDGYSPFHARMFRTFPAVETLRAGEFRLAVSRLSAALEMIQSACEPVIAMLDACLKVVALVRTPEPDGVRSVSEHTLPGMAGMANLDSERCDIETAAEALVHEAIHALVYKVMLSDALMSMPDGARRIRVVSPWSGQRRPLPGFVHACFVWFGLWHFWKRASSQNGQAAGLAERARKGFDGESPLRNIPSEGMRRLAPDVLAALHSMTGEASTTHDSSTNTGGKE